MSYYQRLVGLCQTVVIKTLTHYIIISEPHKKIESIRPKNLNYWKVVYNSLINKKLLFILVDVRFNTPTHAQHIKGLHLRSDPLITYCERPVNWAQTYVKLSKAVDCDKSLCQTVVCIIIIISGPYKKQHVFTPKSKLLGDDT